MRYFIEWLEIRDPKYFKSFVIKEQDDPLEYFDTPKIISNEDGEEFYKVPDPYNDDKYRYIPVDNPKAKAIVQKLLKANAAKLKNALVAPDILTGPLPANKKVVGGDDFEGADTLNPIENRANTLRRLLGREVMKKFNVPHSEVTDDAINMEIIRAGIKKNLEKVMLLDGKDLKIHDFQQKLLDNPEYGYIPELWEPKSMRDLAPKSMKGFRLPWYMFNGRREIPEGVILVDKKGRIVDKDGKLLPEKGPQIAKAPEKPAMPKPVAPAMPKPVAPAMPKPVAPAVPKPVPPAVPKPVAPAVPKPVAPAVPVDKDELVTGSWIGTTDLPGDRYWNLKYQAEIIQMLTYMYGPTQEAWGEEGLYGAGRVGGGKYDNKENKLIVKNFLTRVYGDYKNKKAKEKLNPTPATNKPVERPNGKPEPKPPQFPLPVLPKPPWHNSTDFPGSDNWKKNWASKAHDLMWNIYGPNKDNWTHLGKLAAGVDEIEGVTPFDRKVEQENARLFIDMVFDLNAPHSRWSQQQKNDGGLRDSTKEKNEFEEEGKTESEKRQKKLNAAFGDKWKRSIALKLYAGVERIQNNKYDAYVLDKVLDTIKNHGDDFSKWTNEILDSALVTEFRVGK
jgi:hypothetical protein